MSLRPLPLLRAWRPDSFASGGSGNCHGMHPMPPLHPLQHTHAQLCMLIIRSMLDQCWTHVDLAPTPGSVGCALSMYLSDPPYWQ